MNATMKSGVTFAVDAVTPGTERLATEPMEISVSKLLGTKAEAHDSYSTEVVRQPGYHSLIAAVDTAYRYHFPLVLTPDAIWLTIAQGFARHVSFHAETLRSQFVTHSNKVRLSVRRDDFLRGSPENPWPEIWPEFSLQIQRYLGADTHRMILCNFSTTGPTEKAVSEIVLMDVVQNYFHYEVLTLCGIPTITLEGTVEDWERIREKVLRLAQYDLSWWTDAILPILDEFVLAAEGTPTTSFWSGIYKEEDRSGGMLLSGWLMKLLPYLKHRTYSRGEFSPWRHDQRNPLLKRPLVEKDQRGGILHESLPSSLSSVPFVWQYLDAHLDYQFLGGVLAFTQDATTLAIRPKIGWAVRPAPQGVPKDI